MNETLDAQTPEEVERWDAVYRCLHGMPGMTDENRRMLAARAVELLRESESRQLARCCLESDPRDSAEFREIE